MLFLETEQSLETDEPIIIFLYATFLHFLDVPIFFLLKRKILHESLHSVHTHTLCKHTVYTHIHTLCKHTVYTHTHTVQTHSVHTHTHTLLQCTCTQCTHTVTHLKFMQKFFLLCTIIIVAFSNTTAHRVIIS